MSAYQLKVMLKNSHPPIWRRVIVPDCLTFSQLSVVFNVAMGWEGYHLSDFQFGGWQGLHIIDKDEAFGTANDDFFFRKDFPAQTTYIRDFLGLKQKFTYTYDMGDDWQHQVTVENILTDYPHDYPLVIKYKGDCPPEDCGGIYGFYGMMDDDEPEEDGDEFYPECQPYDLEDVNDFLSFHCVLDPSFTDTRTTRQIYEDIFAGRNGFGAKEPAKTRRRSQPPDQDLAMDDLVAQLKKLLAAPAVKKPAPFKPLKELYQNLTKADLLDLGQAKGIPLKSANAKKQLIQTLWETTASPEVIQSYLYLLDDQETTRLKAIANGKKPPRQSGDIFPILQDADYVFFDTGNHQSFFLAAEVIDTFRQCSQDPGFDETRRRRLWIYKCLRAANILYGITPIPILQQLVQLDDRFSPDGETALLRETDAIPPDMRSWRLEDGALISVRVPDKDALLAIQGDKPFYIPTPAEIEQEPEHFLLDTPQAKKTRTYLKKSVSYSRLPVDDLMLRLVVLIVLNTPFPKLLEFLFKEQNIRFTRRQLSHFVNLLQDLCHHTRCIIHRGHTPEELGDSSGQQEESLQKIDLFTLDFPEKD
ncbi:MAG: plasmid pRiA4b ORF-3 family protein [Schwartzia sp.]|nr:plasmid pRiA4b ORF-3 family protein [Schwartzia sp. (in: firmicutes)]